MVDEDDLHVGEKQKKYALQDRGPKEEFQKPRAETVLFYWRTRWVSTNTKDCQKATTSSLAPGRFQSFHQRFLQSYNKPCPSVIWLR